VLLLVAFAFGALITHRAYTAGTKSAVSYSAALKDDRATLDLITAAKEGISPQAFALVIQPLTETMSKTVGVLTEVAKIVPALSDVAKIADNYNQMIQKGIDDIPNDQQVGTPKPPLTLVKPPEPVG
jgi:hypothetical protein